MFFFRILKGDVFPAGVDEGVFLVDKLAFEQGIFLKETGLLPFEFYLCMFIELLLTPSLEGNLFDLSIDSHGANLAQRIGLALGVRNKRTAGA